MTTFAPASHDAERHDLSGNVLAPPANGASPLEHGLANHSEQNGVTEPAHLAAPEPEPEPSKPTAPVAVPDIPVAAAPAPEPAPAVATEAAPTMPVAAPVDPVAGPDVPMSESLPAPFPNPEAVLPSREGPLPMTAADSSASAPALPAPEGHPVSSIRDEPLSLAPLEVSDQPAAPMAVNPKSEPQDVDMMDATAPVKSARDREEDSDNEPSAKRARMDDSAPMTASAPESKPESKPEPSSVGPPVEGTPAAPPASAPTPAPAAAAPPAQTANGVPPYTAPEVEDFGEMSELHKKRLQEGMRNLKKSKHAAAFAKPVDPDAMGLPTYRQIVAQPMDLATIEQKLKDGQYPSANDYVKDFDLMVQNAISFNGQAHPVAQAGMILRSQLSSQLNKLNKGSDPAAGPARKAARESLASAPRETARRAPRTSVGAGAAPVAPLDGQPIIRRGSNLDDKADRPKRKIQKPAPRDLSYAKTPKKKFQAELKFAQEVLTEVKRPRYETFSTPFLVPVDPVALNIPSYFKVIKKPMDVSTVQEKLNKNQYENLKEFEADFRQIFFNCYKFNPPGTGVYNLGKQYEELFNAEMNKKDARMAVLAPASAAHSPAVDSDEDDSEEDDEDEEEQLRMDKIRALNEQVAAIQQQAAELMSGSWSKPAKGTSKGKSSKGGGSKQRKSSSGAAGSTAPKKQTKTKAAPTKKVKPLTSSQKQEIADHIGELAPEEISRVADQIKTSLRKAGKPVPADDEMEFQIDDIPDDLLHELLGKVRGLASSRARDFDEDVKPSTAGRVGTGQRSKKNKPMSKSEQEAQINRLEGQLATFQNGGGGEQLFGGAAAQDDESSDDEVSGSESEEE